jgi:hypothetical protein
MPTFNPDPCIRREAGDRYVTALPKLFNCMLGKLHHCLTSGQPYNPDEAFRADACRADDQPRFDILGW